MPGLFCDLNGFQGGQEHILVHGLVLVIVRVHEHHDGFTLYLAESDINRLPAQAGPVKLPAQFASGPVSGLYGRPVKATFPVKNLGQPVEPYFNSHGRFLQADLGQVKIRVCAGEKAVADIAPPNGQDCL